ncbi:MAG TPA: ROK family protein [Chloroflexota bacterium]|nr:ROK family protein [Chloroflexota bacterium]
MADVALGIDIGGTKVAAALVAADGTILGRARGAVAPQSNEAGLASITAVVDQLLDSHLPAGQRLLGIGAGAPGAIDWRGGVLLSAANLAWKALPLAAGLRRRYGVPALLDNDVNIAAWGERCYGAGATPATPAAPQNKGERSAPLSDLVFITVGTGIGAGLIEAGRIVRGRRSAGEIGHVPLFEEGPLCRCGMVGCLEALASGPALGDAGRRLAAAGEAPGLLAMAGGVVEAITAPLVVQAALGGDAGAGRLLDREGYYLALAVMIAVRMLDPQRVVLGGGLAEAGRPLFEALWANLARIAPRMRDPRAYVVPASLGADAGAVGGAALIHHPEPGFAGAGLVATGGPGGAPASLR